MRNIKLTIEYDGKDFNGWHNQPTLVKQNDSIGTEPNQLIIRCDSCYYIVYQPVCYYVIREK